MRRYWPAVAVVGVLSLACSPDSLSDPVPDQHPMFVPDPGGGAFNPRVSGLVRVVFVPASAPSELVNTVWSAFMTWEAHLLGQITFTRDANAQVNGQITVTFDMSQSSNGAYWCGDASITLYRKSSATAYCGGRVVPDLFGVAVHEVGQRLGMTTMTTPATSACISNVPSASEGDLNHSLCAHEIEAIRYEYGHRSDAPDMSQLMITGVRPAGSVTVQAGSSASVGAIFECEPSLTMTACPTAPVNWSSSNTGVFTVAGNSSATVSGHAQGSATLSSQVSHVTANTVSSLAPPQSVTVTVTAPPPPPTTISVWISGPDRVDTKQAHSWTAHASGGTSYSYQWHLQPAGSTSWSYMGAGSTLTYIPGAGSDFTLRATVTSGGQTAYGYITVQNCIANSGCEGPPV